MSLKALSNKGNELFHVDGSYNVRRTRFSILRAYEIPPLEAGGNTGKSWGTFVCGQCYERAISTRAKRHH